MNDYLNRVKDTSKNCMIEAIGRDNWDHFRVEDKTDLLTAEMCLRTLSDVSTAADFSASIIPLMKVLENVIIRYFYIPYLDYLRTNYRNPETYIQINNLNDGYDTPDKRRRNILYYRAHRYRYCSGRNRHGKYDFTLGNYQYTVGIEEISQPHCDPTVISFYKDHYFGLDADSDAVRIWIHRLTIKLESLTRLRNDSAHAGTIQSVIDAYTAMDEIVKVNQVILSIMNPSLTE